MFMDTEEFKTEAVTTIVGHPVMEDASIIADIVVSRTSLSQVNIPESLLKRLVRVENHLRERCTSLNAFISGILE